MSAPDSVPVVFRISPLNLLATVALALCATPVAFGAPWFWLVYLVPVGLAGWVLRVRTTAGPDDLVARGALRATRVPWADISALRLRSSRTRSRVSAVLRNGSELPLPAVHVRDLPLLAAASGGRLPDPSEPSTSEPSEPPSAGSAEPPSSEE
ncbi:MAG: PH domain-containing protein [Actinomycetota bacterium]|nr:PH domain-containing protein [Actinomycetota bacterium]